MKYEMIQFAADVSVNEIEMSGMEWNLMVCG